MTKSARDLLEQLFRTAVAAAHPRACLPEKLPQPPATGRLIILAAGKAAGSMAEVAERHYLDDRALPANALTGLAVTRNGYGAPTRVIPVVEAGHPVPGHSGACGHRADLGARRCGWAGGSRAGAAVRGRLGQLDCAARH